MVGSALCHLRGASRSELVSRGEESTDMGGYFVCNGIDRVIRMLIAVSARPRDIPVVERSHDKSPQVSPRVGAPRGNASFPYTASMSHMYLSTDPCGPSLGQAPNPIRVPLARRFNTSLSSAPLPRHRQQSLAGSSRPPSSLGRFPFKPTRVCVAASPPLRPGHQSRGVPEKRTPLHHLSHRAPLRPPRPELRDCAVPPPDQR